MNKIKKINDKTSLIPSERIENKIYLIRGIKVMLDRDLAELYDVETSQLKRQVKRNKDRFPIDFMFILTKEELNEWRCHFGTSNKVKKGLRYAPMAFTEQGVSMLSSVLNSKRAIYVNIQIMRTFTKLRELMISHKDLAHKIKEIEDKFKTHDKNFILIFNAIKTLLEKPSKPTERKTSIGFHTK